MKLYEPSTDNTCVSPLPSWKGPRSPGGLSRAGLSPEGFDQVTSAASSIVRIVSPRSSGNPSGDELSTRVSKKMDTVG